MIRYVVQVLETVQERRTVEVDVPDETTLEGIKAAAIRAAEESQDHATFVGVKNREVISMRAVP